MSDCWERREEPPVLPSEEWPSFYELQDRAEAGVIKRGITRYLTTRNYERSIKLHTYLGSPLTRKAVMATVGRNIPPGTGGSYRLDNSKSKIEAATNFAYSGSVFNEVVHTVGGLPVTSMVVSDVIEGKYGTGFVVNSLAAGASLALVALQRYNRARMIKRVDEELQGGNQFRSGYENWAGIDSRAVKNYEETLEATPPVDAGADTSAIEPFSLRTTAPNETH